MKYLRLMIHIILIVTKDATHLDGPRFIAEPPQWYDFTNSSGAVISCSVYGIPLPTTTWLDSIDNEVTEIPGLRHVLANGSLYLPPFSSEQIRDDIHTTTYRCLAFNSVGKIVSRECKLRPEILSDFFASVENSFTMERNVGVLHCQIRGGSGRVKVVNWLKQEPTGQRIVLVPGSSYSVTSSGSLHIRATTKIDTQASYYCQTVHVLTGERRLSSPGRIFLTEIESNSAPRIEHSPTNVYVRPGNPIDLLCPAQGSPPPVYRWYREHNGILDEIHRGSLSIRPLDSMLSFTNAQRQDNGHYVCVVSNALGEDRKKMNLVVNIPLSVTIKPSRQVVDGGSSTSFNCSITGGNGGHNIAWLKDGRPIHDNVDIRLLNNGEVLLLKSVKRNDGGMYQCLARTSDETEQATAQLILGALPPQFQRTFIEQTVQPGFPVSLSCLVSGTPTPRISWLLDGSPLLPESGYIVGSSPDYKGLAISFLNITSSKVQHGGLYSCSAKNNLGTIVHSASLNVYGPPTSRPPLNITAVDGGNVLLHCPVAGFPISNTIWEYKGERLLRKHQQLSNGTLLLKGLDIHEGGEYKCLVRNQKAQTASSSVFVKIMKPPQIQEFNFPSDLQEGHRAQISCTVISGDLPMDIIWLKDGEKMISEPDVQEQHHPFVNALLFSNIAARHSGTYTCVARNAAAQANYTSKLIVRVAPKWVVEPVDTAVLYQEPVFLHCQAIGHPPPNITWLRTKEDSSEFVPTPVEVDGFIQLENNGTIIIQSASKNHKGHYTCEAKNGIGNGLRKTVRLAVNIPAYFRALHINHSGVAGETFKLFCEAEGDLPLHISWGESPRLVLPTPIAKVTATGMISEIELRDLSSYDAGKYHCNARNAYGFDNMVVELIVMEAPGVPTKVEVFEEGSRWVNIRWEPPGPSGTPITHFIVQFREYNTMNVWNNMTVGGQTFSTRLGTLIANTEYEAQIYAVNKVGIGPTSKSITFITLQEAPTMAPTDITVELSNFKNLIIQWKPINEKESEVRDIAGYQVVFCELGDINKFFKTVFGQKASLAVIESLRNFTKYEISVRAINYIGPGPPSPGLIFTTLEGVPDAAPTDLRCAALSSRSIKVRWEPPPVKHHNGIILGYKVFYKEVDFPRMNQGSISELKVSKSTNLETRLHTLIPSTNYTVRVLAYTAVGDGEISSNVYCSTDEDVPGPPGKVKALVVTSNSIMVAWSSPSEPNGQIIHYNIYIRHSNNELQKEMVFGSKTFMYECRKLVEFERYEFWVTASTSAGEGSKSNKVSQIPLSRAPARITSFSEKIIGGESSNLALDCYAVGLPTPNILWKDKTGKDLTSNNENYRYVVENSLILNPLSHGYSGNYSCVANNVYGADEITYEIIVITIPKPPKLIVVHTTVNRIQVHWKVPSHDSHYISEFLINFKGPDSDWNRVVLEPDQKYYTLKELRCGSTYHITIQSSNSVGTSDPSPITEAHTQGSVSRMPENAQFILSNSTTATVYMDAWPINGCPILYFTISYKAQESNFWTVNNQNITFPQNVVIRNLSPAKKYDLFIKIFTEAGSLLQEFEFGTRTISGELLPMKSESANENLVFSSMYYVVPIGAGIVGTLICAFCLFIVLRKRRCLVRAESKGLVELRTHENHLHAATRDYSPSPARKVTSSLSANKGSDTSGGAEYEISPYATFNLPYQPVTHHMKFQTFSQRECYDAYKPKDYYGYHARSKSRSKLNTSKSPPDGLSLEISCISSQQKLPVERTAHCEDEEEMFRLRRATTSFMSDSESSGEKRTRSHRTLPHKQRQDATVYEHESSTESADMSPDVSRRSRVRRAASSNSSSRMQDGYAWKPTSGFPCAGEFEAECDRFHQEIYYEEIDGHQNYMVKRKRYQSNGEKEDYAIHV